MGLDNPIHIAFLLILLLLVFGAKRLPEMGKSLGSGMRGFKDALSGDDARPEPLAAQPAPAPVAVPVTAVAAPPAVAAVPGAASAAQPAGPQPVAPERVPAA